MEATLVDLLKLNICSCVLCLFKRKENGICFN